MFAFCTPMRIKRSRHKVHVEIPPECNPGVRLNFTVASSIIECKFAVVVVNLSSKACAFCVLYRISSCSLDWAASALAWDCWACCRSLALLYDCSIETSIVCRRYLSENEDHGRPWLEGLTCVILLSCSRIRTSRLLSHS